MEAGEGMKRGCDDSQNLEDEIAFLETIDWAEFDRESEDFLASQKNINSPLSIDLSESGFVLEYFKFDISFPQIPGRSIYCLRGYGRTNGSQIK
jgi:hypothetical protein